MTRILEAFINRPSLSVRDLDAELRGKTMSDATFAEDFTLDKTSVPVSPRSTFTAGMSSDKFGAPPSDPAVQDGCAKTLRSLWSTLLDLPESSISGHDSFFDLGGDSITAMKLAGEARDQGLSLTVADVFRNPCFDAMVARIRPTDVLSTVGSEPAPATTGTLTPGSRKSELYERFSLLAASNIDAFLQTNIVPQVCVFRGGIMDVLPATDFQSLAVTGALLESRWMLNYFYLDGDGPLNLVELKRACFRVVQALDILRTVFVPSDGRFLQVVLRTLRPAFHVIETDEPPQDFKVGQDGTAPKLGESFVEFTVVKQRSTSRHRILLRLSHAQYDGVCFPKILEAIQAAYAGQAVPQPPTFANYLRASAGALTSEHYQHWKELLEGSKMTEIVRRNGPNYNRNIGATPVSLKQSVRLPTVGSGHITAATIVKAAWAYVLAQLSASDDVVFGHTISGRNAAVDGVGNMVGPCLNMVPVRVQFGNGPNWTVRQLLRQVQEQQVANMSHEVLGFREIIRHCTSWPRWTYFSSTVQHQNIDEGGKLRLGRVNYTVGCASAAQEDFADLSIFSRPLTENDKYEIILSFAEGGPIQRRFAERVLDMLCSTAQLFATDPDLALPSAEDLRARPQYLPFDDVPSTSHDADLELGKELFTQLPYLGGKQLADITERVRAAWRQVLRLDADQAAGIAECTYTGPINPGDSFFDLGGDIIGLAQLSWLLAQDQQDSAGPRLEDLIAHPTLRGHIALVAKHICMNIDPLAAEDDTEARKAATFPMTNQKSEKSESPTKFSKMINGFVKRKFVSKRKGDQAVTVS